ncbi:MAG: sulfurtransferase [Bacilli bacterium]
MKKLGKIVVVLSLLGLIVGCSESEVEEYDFDSDSFYLNASELNDMKDDENLIIIDARSNDDYNKGHIEGAINVIWQQLSNVDVNPGEEGFGVVLEQNQLQDVLQNLGFNNDSEIVLYSNGADGWGEDGRILWSLLINGVENLKLLDGGYNAWTSKDFATSKETTTLSKGDITLNNFDSSMVIDTDELVNLIDDGNAKIIDTREEKEYEGAILYGEAKGGKIPTSINIPFTSLYNEDNTIKSQEEVDKIMEENGISKEDKIVTYCTAGIRSASMFVTLKTYGYENVVNYDESFYRWSAVEEVE